MTNAGFVPAQGKVIYRVFLRKGEGLRNGSIILKTLRKSTSSLDPFWEPKYGCELQGRRREDAYAAGPDKPLTLTGPRSSTGVWLRVLRAQSAISSLRANHTPGFDLA